MAQNAQREGHENVVEKELKITLFLSKKYGLRPILATELQENMANVSFYRFRRYLQRIGDFPISEAAVQFLQHLTFPNGEVASRSCQLLHISSSETWSLIRRKNLWIARHAVEYRYTIILGLTGA
jgi:hypothetical protein